MGSLSAKNASEKFSRLGTFKEFANQFQGIDSTSLISLVGGYDNPIPTWFPAPIDCSKISALKVKMTRSRIQERTIWLRFLGRILRVLRHEVSRIQCLHSKPVSTHFCSIGGGGVKFVSIEVTVNGNYV
jgi:hypothetical protein